MIQVLEGVETLAPWYHTIELPGATTPGFWDLRSVARTAPLPASLSGKRCLDAAACEGFWSFELAKRGAQEVVSLDLPDTTQQDWQGRPDDVTLELGSGLANEHFDFIRSVLGGDVVNRVDMNIYDASPERLGTFDVIFVGNILIHLADPVRALRALASVLRPGGQVVSLELVPITFSLLSPVRPVAQLWEEDEARWWTPNKAAHRRFFKAAGLEIVHKKWPVFQQFGLGVPRAPRRIPRRFREIVWWLAVRHPGAASGWVVARRPD